jgi:general stress protein 26
MSFGGQTRLSIMNDEPTAELHEGFSSPQAKARPWSDVIGVLTNAEMFWLSTVRGDGRPHVTPLPAVWLDGVLHFCTGAGEQKGKNLARNPQCVLTTGTNQQHSGLDVVVEGIAERVTDQARLEQLAALWKSKLDWDYTVANGAFHHAHGDDEVLVFGVAPTKVLSFSKGEPFAQTRYRFNP